MLDKNSMFIKILLFISLFFCFPLWAEVGSTNLELNKEKLSMPNNSNINIRDYYSGKGGKGGDMLYIADIITNPNDAFSFNVSVPNDSSLYGTLSGKEIPYIGFILYPTTETNKRPDYKEPLGTILPHMQKVGEPPIFKNDKKDYPLIIYSHGSGDHPLWLLSTLSGLAENGYIVAALFHGDKRFKSMMSDLNALQTIALRPLSIKTAIDVLQNNSPFSNHINFNQIGTLGLSLGASTTMAIMGGKINGPNKSTQRTAIDSRIIASANLNPWLGNNGFSLFGENYSGINGVVNPYLALVGTKDRAAPFQVTRDIISKLGGPKYMIGFTDEGHGFSDEAMMISRTWIQIFFDAYVKNDETQFKRITTMKSVKGDIENFIEIPYQQDN
ncbi:MAG: hypothetical protein HN367_07445 [Candidatus Marinimicrobia bacterium]|nr:hypothetical protein [Candidatus Neomarinimicrobiota bacterium]MBT3502481.1 hypothetical protein [Candidatus Neomarinimicrobiota bacterium]